MGEVNYEELFLDLAALQADANEIQARIEETRKKIEANLPEDGITNEFGSAKWVVRKRTSYDEGVTLEIKKIQLDAMQNGLAEVIETSGMVIRLK